MSKRVPVYLSEEELKQIRSHLRVDLTDSDTPERKIRDTLLEKIEEQLEQFDEN